MEEMLDGPNHDFPGGHSRKPGGHPQGLFQWKSEEHRLHSGPGLVMGSRKMFCFLVLIICSYLFPNLTNI